MTTQPPAHPPRPRLTVRVGVAGHRWDKLKRQHADAICERFNHVFDSIEDVVDQVLTDPDAGYLNPDLRATPPGAVLRVLSGLAEGTDRLGAQVARARSRKWLLTALLPFEREEYVLDFKVKKKLPDGTEVRCNRGEFGFGDQDTASVEEFEALRLAAEGEGGVQELDGAAGKHGAYRQLATALCLNSDVVIAVWDGGKARPGGTGDIIRLAVDYGIPVVRIPMDGVDNPWLHVPGEDEEGRDLELGKDQGLRPLAEHFRRLLVAPKLTKEDKKAKYNARESYFREKVRSLRAGRIYELFSSVLAPKGPSAPKAASTPLPAALAAPPAPDSEKELDHVRALRLRWVSDWTAQGASFALCAALMKTGIHRHYAWASHLASYNGGRYRSAFLMNYMLSWLAVGAAAVGIILDTGEPYSPGVKAAALAEVVLIGSIVAIVVFTGRHRFHSQWLECRRLAEWIRLLPMLLPLSRTPVLGVESNPVLSSQESWVDWMFRAVVREAGVLPLDVGTEMEGACGILAAGVLDGQIDYHERTAERNERIDKILHRIATGAFWLGLVLASYHLAKVLGVHLPVPESARPVLIVLALVIPAFGGAMHGLRSQGDYEATALRSRRIMERLKELRKELKELKVPTVGGVAEIAVKTASVMNAELSAWLLAYQSKAIQA